MTTRRVVDCFEWSVSAAVCSDGSYGVDEGLISSFPLTSDGTTWTIVPGIEHNDFGQKKLAALLQETLVKHAGRCIGIVTHRIPIALIKLRFQDLDPDIVRSLHLPNIHVEEIDV